MWNFVTFLQVKAVDGEEAVRGRFHLGWHVVAVRWVNLLFWLGILRGVERRVFALTLRQVVSKL